MSAKAVHGPVGGAQARPGAAEVVVAEPQSVVYEGLRGLLSRAGDLRLRGWARTGLEAVRLVELVRPRVAVVEPRFPDPPNGVQLVQALRRALPSLGVVVFTEADAAPLAPQMLASGAVGFVLKDSPPEVLLHAVRVAISADGLVVAGRAPSLTLHHVFRALAAGTLDHQVPVLSSREREYLRLVAQGLTDAQIARRLHVARSTVRVQLGRLYRKLRVRNRTQAVAQAVVLGVF